MPPTSHDGRHTPPAGDPSAVAVAAAVAVAPVIGIDVGGTKIAAGLATFPDGRALVRKLTPTLPTRGGQAILDDALRLARELRDEASALGLVPVGIGLGVCELVDRTGRLASANCIPWLDLPVRDTFSTLAPTVMEADVRAAALAEALYGSGQPFRNLLYVTVGTGISCCLVLDGKPYLGSRGATGTMASSPLRFPCEGCGRVNARTLEEIAAGPGLVTRFHAATGIASTGYDLLATALQGDPDATRIVRTASEALGSQVGLLVNTLDPEAVVLGGGLGLGLSESPFWEEFITSTRRTIWSPLHRDLPILRASTGADAGWLGAAARAWQDILHP